ncbi:hypothetical protein NW755_012366 [Fusarium falciforme]|uniref:Uncharacterized protein n=1 Tax=Fusarium falciforme TaxID=195108 RepID=A0A9W8UW66_9HYPO|nr:hypothetical protein NW755_012366 [Fusarium falciforme]
MVSKSLIWERQTKMISMISIGWLLALQLPAALWAGSITPVLTEAQYEALIPIPYYSQSTAAYWATRCAPAEPCDQLLGGISDMGTFSYVAWKTRTGLLLNAVSQASSRDSSIPQHQKLDATGFTYHGRSYGVASAVGLVQPQLFNGTVGTIQNYSFFEDGYECQVSCQYNKTSQLSWIKSDLVGTPGGIYAPQGYWANGSLPNGVWDGFPTWAVVNEGFATALAAVNSQSRYMYGFLAGNAYAVLNQIQCEAKFSPTRFKVEVDVSAKNISVIPVATGSDIDPSRALANISFHGAGYLSQTLTTLYTSVLGDSFLRNIDNVRVHNNRTQAIDQDVINAVEEGLETLIDDFLGSTGAAQVALLQETRSTQGFVVLEAYRIGNFPIATTTLSLVAIIGLAALGNFITLGLWHKICSKPDPDFLDFKTAIVSIAKGAGSALNPVNNWKGDSDDRIVGKLEVKATEDVLALKLMECSVHGL